MRYRSVPVFLSIFIHFAVLGGAAMLFVEPPQFAMDAGKNSVEVNLVAASAPDSVPPPPPPVTQPVVPLTSQPPKPDDLVVPSTPPVTPVPTPPPKPPVQTPHPPVVNQPKPHRTPTLAKGDSSSPKPGKDAVTLSSNSGTIINSQPDYLSNPPPVYPESSRREKQEGLVVLVVIVSADGRADSVSISRSSGFSPLDESAITAVSSWRFRPATMGGMNVKSRVMIPVRFRLDN